MTNSFDPLGLSSASPLSASSRPAATIRGSDRLADKETFLQLLVAQIKNQDPMNPADGTQFVTQLAQFSELEQLLEIRNILDKRLADQEMLAAALLSAQPAQPAPPAPKVPVE